MQDAMESTPSKQFSAYITAREAAQYLHISLSTLHRMESKGLITSYRTPGGHRRYTLEMLKSCLRQGVQDLE